jgi:hypothetical protein
VFIRRFISAFICIGILFTPFCHRHIYHPRHSYVEAPYLLNPDYPSCFRRCA